MASAPSAPALSAVLRCRGRNLWSRSPPTKRPPAAGYSLALPPPPSPLPPPRERQQQPRRSARLTVAFTDRRGEEGEGEDGAGDTARSNAFTEKSYFTKLCRAHAHSSPPAAESGPAVRSLTHTVKSNLPVIYACCRMIRGFELQTCKRIPPRGGRRRGGGVLRVSFTAPPSLNAGGHVSVVLTGSKSSPLLAQLLVLWRSEDGHVLKEDNNNNNTEDLQDQGQSPTCPQRGTEDRSPD